MSGYLISILNVILHSIFLEQVWQTFVYKLSITRKRQREREEKHFREKKCENHLKSITLSLFSMLLIQFE